MDTRQSPNNQEEEEYIDMEVSSSSNMFCLSKSSSPQSREFEFQMSSVSHEKETTPSPADELFYKGKLLPLQIPPRLQMVQKLLLQNFRTAIDATKVTFDEEQCRTPFIGASFTAPPTNSSAPLESCSISPSESRRVSCELNPDEYFFHWSTEVNSFSITYPKKPWAKKFKLIKQSSISEKLKASRAYLKSLFSKSACSDESCAKAAGIAGASDVSKAKEYLNKYMKVGKKNSIGNFGKQTTDEDKFSSHRRSFSGAIKRHCGAKCPSSTSSSNSSSSSSFSLKSNGFYELNLLERSSSANSDIETAIEGAIAHCKMSQQQQNSSTKTESEVTTCLLTAPRVASCGSTGRSELCRL
ncbi:hypothetical protein Nepgr_011961 [Nepenthes gracilis]|uniref:Membrane-associated kinase regulator 4 n=1 Tax=Nepenthes gracilis TaxID=150966 RepID=A0AAD3SG25_NEPGR|nr:hypothetical protein Nepgr_011961 [Nepenthes gracilis]